MTDPQHKSLRVTSIIRETWHESKWCFTVDGTVMGVVRGPDPVSLWPRYSTINQGPLPPSNCAECGARQADPASSPIPRPKRLSWHDGGYVLSSQAVASCLICWKVKLRLWNVSNTLRHIGKSQGLHGLLLISDSSHVFRVHACLSVCLCGWMKVKCRPWAFSPCGSQAKFHPALCDSSILFQRWLINTALQYE